VSLAVPLRSGGCRVGMGHRACGAHRLGQRRQSQHKYVQRECCRDGDLRRLEHGVLCRHGRSRGVADLPGDPASASSPVTGRAAAEVKAESSTSTTVLAARRLPQRTTFGRVGRASSRQLSAFSECPLTWPEVVERDTLRPKSRGPRRRKPCMPTYHGESADGGTLGIRPSP
jgi:hypothetical protein